MVSIFVLYYTILYQLTECFSIAECFQNCRQFQAAAAVIRRPQSSQENHL